MPATDELLLFLDDCELSDASYVGRAGFMVRRSRVNALGTGFLNVLLRRGVPVFDPLVDTEVKWNPARGNFFNGHADRDQIYRELLDLIRQFECVSIGAVVILKEIHKAGWNRRRARAETITYVTERAERYMRHVQLGGRSFPDEETARYGEDAIDAAIQRLVIDGSKYVTFERLSPDANALASRSHFGVQLADLVAGTTTRRVADFAQRASNAPPLNARSVPVTNHLWAALKGTFANIPSASAVDNPGSYGLMILPTLACVPFVTEATPYSPVDESTRESAPDWPARSP